MCGSRGAPSLAHSGSEQLWTPAVPHSPPQIAKCADVLCTHCGGRGSKGFICKSHCHCCEGTGEASKKHLLRLFAGMELGDVHAAVLLHAASAEKRNDRDIVLAAVGRFPKAVQFASERLKASREVRGTVASADAALQRDIPDRSPNSLSNSQNSPQPASLSLGALLAAAGARSPRVVEVPEVAADWGSFSQEVS